MSDMNAIMEKFILRAFFLLILGSKTFAFVYLGVDQNSNFEKKSCKELIEYADRQVNERRLEFERRGNFIDCSRGAIMQRARKENGLTPDNADSRLGAVAYRYTVGTVQTMRTQLNLKDKFEACQNKKEEFLRSLDQDYNAFAKAIQIRMAIYDTQFLYTGVGARNLFGPTCSSALVDNSYARLRQGIRESQTRKDRELIQVLADQNCNLRSNVNKGQIVQFYKLKGPVGADRLLCSEFVEKWTKANELNEIKTQQAGGQPAHEAPTNCDKFIETFTCPENPILRVGIKGCLFDAFVHCLSGGISHPKAGNLFQPPAPAAPIRTGQ